MLYTSCSIQQHKDYECCRTFTSCKNYRTTFNIVVHDRLPKTHRNEKLQELLQKQKAYSPWSFKQF